MEIVILIVVLLFLIYNNSKSSFIKDIVEPSYSTPKSCDFTDEFRPYPSGAVPGSYLGLSEQEKQTALKRFVEYKQPSSDEYSSFQES